MIEGKAALAKKASEEYDQIVVARDWNPNGERIIVAGSSFIVSIKTRIPPAKIPDVIIGIVILKIVYHILNPKLLDASSIWGLICNIDDFTAPKVTGRNRIRYPKISNPKVWYKGEINFIPTNITPNAIAIPGRPNATYEIFSASFPILLLYLTINKEIRIEQITQQSDVKKETKIEFQTINQLNFKISPAIAPLINQ